MKIGIDMGHTLSGADIGAHANGVSEEKMTREVGKLVIAKLKTLGHTVVNCTKDNASSVNESLAYRYNTANKANVSLFVCIHMNCFNTSSPHGSEVYIHSESSSSKIYAENILKELGKCGYTKRGVYVAKDYLGYNLAVLANTNAPALLVECLFISNPNDLARYNADNIADAIVKGITGKTTNVSGGSSTKTTTEEKLFFELQGYIGAKQDNFAGPETLGKCPTLKAGSMGNVVRILQKLLNKLINAKLEVDGMFGGMTAAAVRVYQSQNSLVVDSVVGKKTWSKILGLS